MKPTPALTVVAFGGHALVPHQQAATQRLQIDRAEALAALLLPLLDDGGAMMLVHGNGPQVGDELVRVEEAVNKVPPLSLDLCVAATAGTIGVLLERALRNAACRAGRPLEVITLVTMVEVAAPGAGSPPRKPVGASFTRYRAEALGASLGWSMVETAPGTWRRVVPSPLPQAVVGVEAMAGLLAPRRVLIAGGGGGVPVARDAAGRLSGVEAVIDKDWVAGRLAEDLGARRLLFLTDVDEVHLDHGTDRQRPVAVLTTAAAAAHLAAGQFPPGSMGPKIEAALKFVGGSGGEVLITSLEGLASALAGKGGTRMVA